MEHSRQPSTKTVIPDMNVTEPKPLSTKNVNLSVSQNKQMKEKQPVREQVPYIKGEVN
jgi:hypothetical protein